MACCLVGADPLPEPMLLYCKLGSREQVSVKFKSKFYHFNSRKCIWKCRLQKWLPFCQGEYEVTAINTIKVNEVTILGDALYIVNNGVCSHRHQKREDVVAFRYWHDVLASSSRSSPSDSNGGIVHWYQCYDWLSQSLYHHTSTQGIIL